jgi:hypothetical protein
MDINHKPEEKNHVAGSSEHKARPKALTQEETTLKPKEQLEVLKNKEKSKGIVSQIAAENNSKDVLTRTIDNLETKQGNLVEKVLINVPGIDKVLVQQKAVETQARMDGARNTAGRAESEKTNEQVQSKVNNNNFGELGSAGGQTKGNTPEVSKTDSVGGETKGNAPEVSKTDSVVGQTKGNTPVETQYYNQYFSDKNDKTFPKSLLVVQDKNDQSLALVSTKDKDGKEKLNFKKLEEIGHKDSGHEVKLFTDMNMLAAIVHNFKAGFNQSNLVMDKAYVALNRPIEHVEKWISAKKDVEKSKVKFSESEIPYSALEKIGIKKSDIKPDQVSKLLKGENTDLLKVSLKNKEIELKEVPPYTIKLERKDDKIVAKLTFQKDRLDLTKDKIGSKLSKSEQVELVKNGEVKPQSTLGAPNRVGSNIVVWNKTTNVLEKKVIGNSPEQIKEAAATYGIELSPKEQKMLQEGKKVMVENAINPQTEKKGKAFISFGRDEKINSDFTIPKEIKKEKNLELTKR